MFKRSVATILTVLTLFVSTPAIIFAEAAELVDDVDFDVSVPDYSDESSPVEGGAVESDDVSIGVARLEDTSKSVNVDITKDTSVEIPVDPPADMPEDISVNTPLTDPLLKAQDTAIDMPAVTADSDYIYYSDLFYGYSTSYLKSDLILTHTKETYNANMDIFLDYTESPQFIWTSIKTSISASTSPQKLIQLISSASGGTDYIYQDALDSANVELMKSMFSKSDSVDFGNGKKILDASKNLFTIFKEIEKDILPKSVRASMTEEEIFTEVFELVSSRGLFHTVNSSHLNTITTTLLTDAKKYVKWASVTGDALEAAEVILIGIMMEDVRCEIIDEILKYAPKDSTIYEGMTRLKNQLYNRFVSYFIDQYLSEAILSKIAKTVLKNFQGDSLGSFSGMWSIVTSVIDIMSIIVFDIIFDVPDLDDMILQKVLTSYSDDLYKIMFDDLNGMYNVHFSKTFKSDDIKSFAKIFDMYVAATNCALEASKKLTTSANSDTLNAVIHKYSDFTYTKYIDDIKETIKQQSSSERTYKQFETWRYSSEIYRSASDSIEDSSIYLFKGKHNANISIYSNAIWPPTEVLTSEENIPITINGSVNLDYYGKLNIPKDVEVIVEDDVNINDNSAYLDIFGRLKIKGNFVKVEIDPYDKSDINNYGLLSINGDFYIGSLNYCHSNKNAVLEVGGDMIASREITLGTVVFNGTEQQSIYIWGLNNVEVTNPKGIKYDSSLDVYGHYDLHGNPLDNNGWYTVCYSGCSLESGSDYKLLSVPYGQTVYIEGYITADIKCSGELIVEENKIATIDGYVNIYDYFLRVDGELNITSSLDLSPSTGYSGEIYMDKPSAILRVAGNADFSNTPYCKSGTIIFDGTKQQTVKGLEAKNIEVTNPEGIKYLSSVYLYGEYKLNNNPLDNNGYSTLLYEGTSFADDSDYGSLYLKQSITLSTSVKGNIVGGNTITVPEGADIVIDGDVSCSVTNNGKLRITGDYSSYTIRNDGILDIDGDLSTTYSDYSLYQSKKEAVLCIGGNFSWYSVYNCQITAGTVKFDGTDQQTVKNLKAKNIEVTNPEGIKYLSSVYLLGEYKLNNNPLDNNGYNTYLSNGCSFGDDSDYGSLHLNESITLSTSVKGNISGGSTMTIPEGSDIVIDGNVRAPITNNGRLKITENVTGYTIQNNGIMDINGDLTSSGYNNLNQSNEEAILYIGGNFSWYSTGYCNITSGTVIFDGTVQQTVKYLKAPIIILENKSSDGVKFTSSITVSKLFDHKGNNFTLYNKGSGSSFVDYDGDGVTDNLDPEPTVGPNTIPELSVDNYVVTITAASNIKDIRFALGEYSKPSEIKAVEGNVAVSNSLVKKYTVDGRFVYEMADGGLYTFWVRTTNGKEYFLIADMTHFTPTVSTYGVTITLHDLYDVKDFFIAKGEYNTYREIKDNGYIVSVTGAKIAGKHDYTYTVYEPGMHTILIRYNDGTTALFHEELTVDEPVFTTNGLQVTVSNLPDVKVIRTAYGEWNSVRELKATDSIRNFSAKTAIKGKDPYTIQYREEGIVTIIVEYNNGYQKVFHYEVTKKAPTVEQDDDTVTFGNLDGLVTLRYAVGLYTTSSQIKNAAGSKALKPADIVNGNISVTLESGTYTFCVQYDDESYNYYAIIVE